MKENLTWAQLLLKVLAIVESMLPAFMVAWSNATQNKLERKHQKILNNRLQLEVEKNDINEAKKYQNKSDRDVVDDFIRDSKG
jgi:hypothetical protein